MSPIPKPREREIIEDFAKEIEQKKLDTVKPSKTVIKFRTDYQDRNERTIYRVPIDILRYRKDNGRISSDVEDFEENVRPLDERDETDQALLGKWLEEKDPEKTAQLRKLILHEGQREPAIITCDGFLINGNRRKMVMQRLRGEFPEKAEFAYMKVVILPGKDDEGAPPTLLEIEKIENRYQLQSDGKAEYYGFDRALSIRRKISLGLSLREQLRDDPQFANATKAELDKAEKDYWNDYLTPLECVGRYLKQFKRSGQYRYVSSGISDREGRWQALKDYSVYTYSRNLQNPKKLIELGIDEDEVGTIEESAFDIIRLRTVPDMPKVHMLMRNLPKYCKTKEGKKQILKIAEEVDPVLPPEETQDAQGNPMPATEVDARWAAKYKRHIVHRLKKASLSYEARRDRETPLDLLEAAYKKLTHDNMELESISASDLGKARKLAAKIKNRADELENEAYRLSKSYKELLGGDS